MIGTLVLAQAADTSSVFIQYGALGVITLLALGAIRVLFLQLQKVLDLERQRGDRLEAELREHNKTAQEKYMLTMTEATRVMSEVVNAIKPPRA